MVRVTLLPLRPIWESTVAKSLRSRMTSLVIEEQYLNTEDKLVPKTLTLPLRRKDKKEG